MLNILNTPTEDMLYILHNSYLKYHTINGNGKSVFLLKKIRGFECTKNDNGFTLYRLGKPRKIRMAYVKVFDKNVELYVTKHLKITIQPQSVEASIFLEAYYEHYFCN